MKNQVYWKEECEYCLNRKKCDFRDTTKDFRGAISNLANNTKDVKGKISFSCAYFNIDEEEYSVKTEDTCSNTDNKEKKMPVVTLCGSTKFKNEFIMVQKKLSMKGYVVLTVGLFGHSGDGEVFTTEGVKEMLDKVHLRKIDMSDEIFVINVDGYIGDSTKNEIRYAVKHGKKIKFLTPDTICQDFLNRTVIQHLEETLSTENTLLIIK